MTTTLTPNLAQLDRDLAELQVIKETQVREAQRAAQEQARIAAELAAEERERTLDAIDLQPFDAAVYAALDSLDAAARAVAAASQQREQAKASAVETITPFVEQSERIRPGASLTLDGYRLASTRREEITEICRIVAPLLRSVGGSLEHETITVVANRVRAGNRLQRQER